MQAKRPVHWTGLFAVSYWWGHKDSTGEAQAFLWDTEAPGLALRATPGESRAYIFQSKLHGKALRVTIGDVRAWNLDAARTEARRLQTLLDAGTDPRELAREKAEAKRAAKEAKRAAEEAARLEAERTARYTLRALCDAYTDILERPGKKSASSARSLFRCHIDADTANKPARDISAHEVAALVRKVRESGKERAAGMLRSFLSAAFNAGKRAPFDSAMPADLIGFGIEHNPVDAIPTIPVRRGVRTLSAEELRAYIGHLRRVGQDAGPELADMALLLALYAGGQRMAQLLRVKVGDFDQDTGARTVE